MKLRIPQLPSGLPSFPSEFFCSSDKLAFILFHFFRSTFARWFGINSSKTSPQVVVAEQQEQSASQPDSISYRDDASQSGESCVSSNPSYSEGGALLFLCCSLECILSLIFFKSTGRNLVSVLTRVSNLLAQNGMYSESEFKQFWMPDSVSKECYECSYKFTALRRRHHCRICGQIFCARCCHQQVPGKVRKFQISSIPMHLFNKIFLFFSISTADGPLW